MRRIAILAVCLCVAGCTGSPGGAIPQPHFLGSTGLSVTPGSLSMGPGDQASLQASESGFTGSFTAQSSAGGVATVAQVDATSFQVTAVGVGSATITVSDGKGGLQTVSVSVQSTVIGGQ